MVLGMGLKGEAKAINKGTSKSTIIKLKNRLKK
jgi:hypothetical protein